MKQFNQQEQPQKKKTPDDFMMEEFDELYKLYKDTQFKPTSIESNPALFIKQKSRMVFDILCDRIGKHHSQEYNELIEKITILPIYEANNKLLDLKNAVISATDISADTMICRSIWKVCNHFGFKTSSDLANYMKLTRMDKMDLIPYFRKYAAQYIIFKKTQYLPYVQENISFWRATKGESLPVTEKAYLWAEAIWICHERVGYCFTDELWKTIKKAF